MGIANTQADRLIIAYEPIWAVGTDVVPESNEVMEVRILIRKILSELYSPELAERIPILYGGSV
ncbi:MAG: Triosephosphate isomerase, partial [Candidatus Moranbacteria bacterium GW2011_GWC2_45_10]